MEPRPKKQHIEQPGQTVVKDCANQQ